MEERIVNYKCPNCTGPLRYDEALGKLKCDHCESVFTAEEIQAQMEAEQAQEQAQEDASFWDISAMTENWGEGSEKLAVYNCPSCGAELICEKTTAATDCPYCGNHTILLEQLRGALKPDYVIPFQVTKERAVAALKEHYKGKIFLPKTFKEENHIQEVKGIYVPFWLFDGTADADVMFHATRTHVHREGNDEVTVTEHFNVHRAGSVDFEKIPVDASSKMPDEYMDAIEPFNYSEMKEFSTAYLPGFLADKYDVMVENCSQRADERAAETVYRAMESSVVGYMGKVCVNKRIALKRGQVKYAMLPVWLLSTKWKGKNFLFAMNGQTGKMVGDLPVSLGRFWGLFAAITAPLTAIVWLLLQ